jgi:ATP-binding cassette subfamily F protein 3
LKEEKMLIVSNVSYINESRKLLDDVSFVVDRETKVIIGENGSGKTTLLEIIVGNLPKDSGSISLSGTYSYVPQEVKGIERTGIYEIESGLNEIKALELKLSELEVKGNFGDEFSKLIERYEAIGGYSYRQEIYAMLDEFGLARETAEHALREMSGGERTKCLMVKAFISEPDILILDEPTNHLDIETIKTLEEHLASFKGGILIVSHDKTLINKIARSILYLENGFIKEYPGNYDKFITIKEADDERAIKEKERLSKYLAKEREFIEKFRYGTRATQAKSREKKIERIELPELSKKRDISIRIQIESRGGEKVLEIKHLSKIYNGKPVLSDVNLKIMRGERVGIVGRNGSGKTTLLKIIVGEENLDKGSVYIGAGIEIGYFPQDAFFLDGPQTVLDEILKEGLDISPARDFLASFDFTGNDVFKVVGELSGGEKRRLLLAKMGFIKGNFLVLDEPTNHLDIETNDAVISALKNFTGTTLLVTHDRYLLKEIVEKIYYIEDGIIKDKESERAPIKEIISNSKEINKIKARISYLEKLLQTEPNEKKEKELKILKKKLESME